MENNKPTCTLNKYNIKMSNFLLKDDNQYNEEFEDYEYEINNNIKCIRINEKENIYTIPLYDKNSNKFLTYVTNNSDLLKDYSLDEKYEYFLKNCFNGRL
jgi:hypothetical protein